MLAGIQNPCPAGERDINALLTKRRAKLGRNSFNMASMAASER
jgi:hypothetical protein